MPVAVGRKTYRPKYREKTLLGDIQARSSILLPFPYMGLPVSRVLKPSLGVGILQGQQEALTPGIPCKRDKHFA
jgi:hypothetical protein